MEQLQAIELRFVARAATLKRFFNNLAKHFLWLYALYFWQYSKT